MGGMSRIDPRAVVDPQAELGEDVEIGPFCVVGAGVKLGDGCVLKSHISIEGNTELGAGCVVWPFASVGAQTQDLKYKGGNPGVRIGARTTLREYVTVNAATFDGDLTVIGDGCHIMAYCHVAHDCIVGNEVIMANAATLAGHVIVEDQAIIGGLCGIHQFVKIGELSITGGCSKVVMDVPPYMMADGTPLAIRGINKIGLERHGADADEVRAMKEAYRTIYRKQLGLKEAVASMRSELADLPRLNHLCEFLENTERGITR